MIGLGTIVNVGIGAYRALLSVYSLKTVCRNALKTVMQGPGLTTCFIGIGGTLSEVLTIQNGEIGTQHTMLLLIPVWHSALSSVKR